MVYITYNRLLVFSQSLKIILICKEKTKNNTLFFFLFSDTSFIMANLQAQSIPARLTALVCIYAKYVVLTST